MTGWQIDRHIPIAVILTLMFQTAGVVWWAATLEQRLNRVEQWQEKNDATRDRLTTIESQMDGIKESLERIEKKLDK